MGYLVKDWDETWQVQKRASLRPKMPDFLMREMEAGVGNCTLTAITRLFAYYREKEPMRQIPPDAEIYRDVKAIAQKHRYKEKKSGTPFVKINNIAKELLQQYGCHGRSQSVYLWDYHTVVREIDAGRPMLFNIAFGEYENHTVTVTGYAEIRRWHEKKRLIEVHDGWSKEPHYIDIKQIQIGSFTTIRMEHKGEEA